jgi:hypothetical protein
MNFFRSEDSENTGKEPDYLKEKIKEISKWNTPPIRSTVQV